MFWLLFYSFFNSTIESLFLRVGLHSHLLLGKRGAAGRAQAEEGTSLAAAAVAADPHSSKEAQGRAALIPRARFPFAFFKICRRQSVSENVPHGSLARPEEALRCPAPGPSGLIGCSSTECDAQRVSARCGLKKKKNCQCSGVTLPRDGWDRNSDCNSSVCGCKCEATVSTSETRFPFAWKVFTDLLHCKRSCLNYWLSSSQQFLNKLPDMRQTYLDSTWRRRRRLRVVQINPVWRKSFLHQCCSVVFTFYFVVVTVLLFVLRILATGTLGVTQ